MQDNSLQPIVYMAKHDPAVIAGLLLVAGASVLFIHIQLKMIRSWLQNLLQFFRETF